MLAAQEIEDAPPAQQEDPVAYIIYEVLPRFVAICEESAAARWRRRLVIAEVDRLCAEYGPL